MLWHTTLCPYYPYDRKFITRTIDIIYMGFEHRALFKQDPE